MSRTILLEAYRPADATRKVIIIIYLTKYYTKFVIPTKYYKFTIA